MTFVHNTKCVIKHKERPKTLDRDSSN